MALATCCMSGVPRSRFRTSCASQKANRIPSTPSPKTMVSGPIADVPPEQDESAGIAGDPRRLNKVGLQDEVPTEISTRMKANQARQQAQVLINGLLTKA